MGRCIVIQLENVLPQIGLNGFDTHRFKVMDKVLLLKNLHSLSPAETFKSDKLKKERNDVEGSVGNVEKMSYRDAKAMLTFKGLMVA